MKVFEIIESKDPYYASSEDVYNPESSAYRDEESKSSEETDATDVVTGDVDNGEPDWTTKPQEGDVQSPGFRAKQEALNHAGQEDEAEPYDKFDPQFLKREVPADLGNGISTPPS